MAIRLVSSNTSPPVSLFKPSDGFRFHRNTLKIQFKYIAVVNEPSAFVSFEDAPITKPVNGLFCWIWFSVTRVICFWCMVTADNFMLSSSVMTRRCDPGQVYLLHNRTILFFIIILWYSLNFLF